MSPRSFVMTLAAGVLLVPSSIVHAASPVHAWSRGAGSNGDDVVCGVAYDGPNLCVVGSFSGSVDFGGGQLTSAGGQDVFIAEYDPSGAYMWSKRFGGPGDDRANAVAMDAYGNAYITGYFQISIDFGGGALTCAGADDIFVAKFNHGEYVWGRRFGGHFGAGEMGCDVQVDSYGTTCVVTGAFVANPTIPGLPPSFGTGFDELTLPAHALGNDTEIFVAILNDGVLFYSYAALAGSFGYFDRGNGCALANGFVTVAGYSGIGDIYVAQFAGAGLPITVPTLVWQKTIGGTDTDQAEGVAVSPFFGDVAVVGHFRSPMINLGGSNLFNSGTNDDIFVARYTSDGTHLWSKSFGSPSTDDQARSVAYDPAERMFVGGYFGGSVDFGGGQLSASGTDIFLASFKNTGAHDWSRKFGSLGDDNGESVAVRSDGIHIALGGGYGGTINFGGTNLPNNGGRDEFAADFAVASVSPVSASPFATSLAQNYPNPFNPRTTIEYVLSARTSAQVVIYDATGRRVRMLDQGTQDPGSHRVEWNGLDDAGKAVSSGVYFYRLNGDVTAGTRKMILLK